MSIHRPQGMYAFTIVWFGQVISLTGSAMTTFALTIWTWTTFQSATIMGLVAVARFAPTVILSPIAGALVDRWNRKVVLMISDVASLFADIILLILYVTGQLEIWQILVLGVFSGAFRAFQWPAYSAAISTMIPKEHYGRASGMISLAESGAGILAPLLAGALILIIGLQGILTIDIITFVIAILTLLKVSIPQPDVSKQGQDSHGSLWQESVYGFRYIWALPPLFALQLLFTAGNLLATMGGVLFGPYVLSLTQNNTAVFGSIEGVGAIGGVVGAALMTAWGGPRRRILGVVGGFFLYGILFACLTGLGKTIGIWMFANFCGYLVIPILDGSNQAIWQSKVPPDIQGRVFSVRMLIAQISSPIGLMIGGPLADKIFTPAMENPDSLLSQIFGGVFGTGPGAGMGLIIFLTGVLMAVVSVAAYAYAPIRNVEAIIPDHDVAVKLESRRPAALDV